MAVRKWLTIRSLIGTLDWTMALQKADDFVANLTLDEKLMLVQGNSSAGSCISNINSVPCLGFRGVCIVDGPAGINRADLVNVFPSGITAAATWDREMIYRRG